jgi:putative transposase
VLKQQLLWIERFDTLEELRQAVRRFGRTYSAQRLIERYGYRTPIEAREQLRAKAATAA